MRRIVEYRRIGDGKQRGKSWTKEQEPRQRHKPVPSANKSCSTRGDNGDSSISKLSCANNYLGASPHRGLVPRQ